MKNELIFFKTRFSLIFINLVYSLAALSIGLFKLIKQDSKFSFLPFISLFIILNVYAKKNKNVFGHEVKMLLILNALVCFTFFLNFQPWLEFTVFIFYTVIFSLFVLINKANILNLFIGFRELLNVVFFLFTLKVIFLVSQVFILKYYIEDLEVFAAKSSILIEIIAFTVFIISILIYFISYKKENNSTRVF
ncbi:hypothetical protein HX057_16930 [Myroides odoratimimus]|uniref:Uncharacterized protein n=3 Tax=Myroides odoratimimus TaxID=76832 RepID=A0A0S7EK47_9FLAO|nr:MULTISPECIES: hypothetical protein [Myroides]AJA70112.1 hypothetical protein MYRA21_3007 [Myroides sp. A21]ALU27333.1 hypothetical protein AS202_14695 [Myroides odoratimimus]APA93375.1 hypothetical protein BK054_14300 [Myroides sp. ZB35]EHO09243.1 hypothetical protein HMPREF9714_01921 [Myroides odoratimimus CCUG 12901]EHO11613.1 hypothetical protein HMPREF9715_01962 [Myroides odoratimimus CIP 101113]